jgi:alcohol dehydrogenase
LFAIEERIPNGEFVFPPIDKVTFGPGSLETLPEQVERLGCTRAFVITTSSIATKTPLLDRLQKLLGSSFAGAFSDVKQHNPARAIVAAVQHAEEAGADLIVSLGGGSVIDNAKASILALARDTAAFPPHIALPTTLSAAEFSPTFGITDEKTRTKTRGSNPFVQPRLVILDVDLTEHTPNWLWNASGVRALDHAVESIYAPDHQPATDAGALEAIRLLFEHLPASTAIDGSKAARQQCQIAAWLSFFGSANVTLGLSHALGREIGPYYDVPHGYTSAVLLPKVMAYLLPETFRRQALIARAAGIPGGDRSENELALEAPVAVGGLIERLGLPRRLRDLDVPESDLPKLAAGREDVLHVLREAW